MPVNILNLVHSAVVSHIGLFSGILDESEEKTNAALEAAVSQILSGLITKAGTDDGAKEIFQTLDDYDGKLLDHLGGLLGGGNHNRLLNRGTSLMGLLFGDKLSSAFATTAQLAELGEGKAATLLGLLAPVVMGVLGRERRTQELAAREIATLISSQEQYLGDLQGELTDAWQHGDQTRHGEVASVESTAGTHDLQAEERAGAQTERELDNSTSGFLWSLLPLILLAALTYYAFSMFTNPSGAANEVADPDATKIEATP